MFILDLWLVVVDFLWWLVLVWISKKIVDIVDIGNCFFDKFIY